MLWYILLALCLLYCINRFCFSIMVYYDVFPKKQEKDISAMAIFYSVVPVYGQIATILLLIIALLITFNKDYRELFRRHLNEGYDD